MLTAYDYTTARIIDAGGVDSILIGDSASNVMAGNSDTLPITVDQIIYHARAVARAVDHALVLCDMPFGSYQVCKEEAVRNAVKIMKETGVDALKLEGGVEILPAVEGILAAGIPVCGSAGDQAAALFGQGCFLEATPSVTTPDYTDYNPELGGGTDILYNTRSWILHPNGVSFLADNITGETPTDAELANKANWALRFQHQNVRIGKIEIRADKLS